MPVLVLLALLVLWWINPLLVVGLFVLGMLGLLGDALDNGVNAAVDWVWRVTHRRATHSRDPHPNP